MIGVIIFLAASCSARAEYIGYYADELAQIELEKNQIVFSERYRQKEEIEIEFDSVSFVYKSTSTYEWGGETLKIIDFGYLLATKGNQIFILGKYTPTIIYNADGQPIIEILESHPTYKKIVGLSRRVAEYALAMWLNIRNDDGTIVETDPYSLMEIDIPNRTIFKYDWEAEL